MANWEKNQPLDKNAFLDAENLFRKTGDLRYLIIAIGKAGGEHYQKSKDDVSQRLIDLCNDYAETVRQMTAFDRVHVVSSNIDPLPSDEKRELFRNIMDQYFYPSKDTENSKLGINKNGQVFVKRTSFTELCRQNGIDEVCANIAPNPIDSDNLIREFKRWMAEECDLVRIDTDDEDGEIIFYEERVNRRIEEIAYVRHSHKARWEK